MTSLKNNFIYNIGYQILLIILPLITAPYISRVLGVDGIGTYSYIYSIAYYFGLCGMLGISNHGNRSIALVRNDKKLISTTFWNLYCIQFVFTAIAITTYIIYIATCFKGNKIIAYIDTLFVISYMLDINWFFFGMEQFKLTVTRNIIVKLATVVATFIFVRSVDDLWKYTLILALSTIISQVYLWFYCFKFVDIVKPSWRQIKEHIKPTFILFIPVMAFGIYKVMDKIMLGSMTTVTQVGLYENAEKIVNIPVGIINAFGTVMMPRISSLIANDDASQIEKYNRQSFRYFTLIVAAMVFGLIGISDILAPVYFGNEFIKSGPLIAGLSVMLLFMTWANIIRTQYLIPNKKDKPYIISTLIGALVNLAFNVIFIPRLQSVGALIGTVIAEFVVFAVQAYFVRKEFFVVKYLKSGVPFLLIGSVMCTILRIISLIGGRTIITLIVQIFTGGIVYCLLSFLYLYWKKDIVLLNFLMKLKRD